MNTIPQSYELWRSVVLRFKDWRQRRAAVWEISQLGNDGERMLAECGLSRSDFRQAMRLAFASKILLPEAIKSKGIDAETFENRYPEWNRDMRRTCMMCPARRVCSDRLETRDFEASYRDFCPNADNLDALAGVAIAGWRARNFTV
ncbi:hypothetical protein IG197_30070 (plasmid) [Aminobacter sp. SR38]|jgi:uncharacterized protein YjiS (DUF1127 family)|uniref:hypothetical protein n=1 Tax=Aminobacter sp. SR38 TaxID=2774562 RepID=UPI001787329D|nr:hypothetical protein [Aminobacter sp. SR38]QOF74580.1 hypothetical protein IG197_30070 [Aminobacter sp. SR38]